MDFEDLLWEPHHIHPYHPYTIYGERNPKFDGISGHLLDLKSNTAWRYAAAIRRFKVDIENKLDEILHGDHYVAVLVPSSTAERHSDGLTDILSRIAGENSRISLAIKALRRHTSIQKLAHGGPREVSIHLQSIDVPKPEEVHGQRVLLLDDICTTGNSMIACRRLLLDVGAVEVVGLAIGKTTHD